MLKAASLFSGCGGFDLAFQNAGIETILQCEFDRQCRSVLARHWPNCGRINDVRELKARMEPRNARRLQPREFVRPDILCGGFPCQDVSVAGRRAGLAGARSGLWWTFRRIIALWRPRWVCIENVPGLLSSNDGRDFGAVIGPLAKLGYGVAYRVLDSQWFGVPQRRRRVFIVGCFGDVRSAANVLFESDCLPWDPPPRRTTGKRVADTITAGVAASRGVNRPGRRREDVLDGLAGSLGGGSGKRGWCDDLDRATFITVRAAQGGNNAGGGGAIFVPQTFRAGVRRLTPRECERLQGFPDDWTRWDAVGNELSDSARYRMMGNAVTVPVVEWIAKRIVAN